MRRVWRALMAVVMLTTYFAAAPFGYGAFALLQLKPAREPRVRARRLQAVMRRAFTLMHDSLRWLGLIDFNPRHIVGEIPDGPVVLVGNHPSLCDVTSVVAALPDVTTVVKPGLYAKGWARPLLEGALHFEGTTGTGSPAKVIEAGLDRIHQGFRVLIFPEGTRSPPGGLHTFGRTAFEIACKANVPVVPLVFHWEPVYLSRESPIFPIPKTTPKLTLEALPAVHPTDHDSSSRKLRDVVDGLVRERLGMPRAADTRRDGAQCSKNLSKSA